MKTMTEYHQLGVGWLDRGFSKALDDEELQQRFSVVSSSLAPLVRGTYDSEVKQAATFSLLGPAFVCKHFSQDEAAVRNIRRLERLQGCDMENERFSATFSKVRSNLENMAMIAMQRSFPPGRQRELVKERVERILSESVLAARQAHSEQQDQTDFISNSIAALLELDRREKFELNLLKVAKETFARRSLGIPHGLRKPLWDSYLSDNNEHSSEQIIKMSSSLRKMTPQTGSNVIDMFQTWAGLRDLEDRAGYFQLAVSRVLGHFYQDQSSVFWLAPLLYTYGGNLETDCEDENFQVQLGLKMVAATDKCKLTREDIFSSVEEIYTELRVEDLEYHQHLHHLSEDAHHIHSKDFDKEMLSLSDTDCNKTWKTLNKNAGVITDKVRNIFSDGGKIYVRQWLQTGFVSVLNKECLLYVWDILFLNDWSKETLKIIVMAMMILLRFWMFRGRSYRGLRNTFLREPFLIYLLDLRRAIRHLASGGKVSECPQSSNWRVQVVPPKPYWQEIRIRRESLVKKIDKDNVGLLPDVIGAIKSNFRRKESVSSVESIEQVEAEPWLELWQPYNKDHDKTIPAKLPRLSGTFDIYIDGIRFLPQSISVAKISGNIFNLEMDLGGFRQFPNFPVEFECCPSLKSFARFPSFNFKLPVNREKQMLNPNAILYLKIFGSEEHSGRNVLVGTTMLSLFKPVKGSPLNYGGHQLQCRRGSPDLSLSRLEHLHVTDMEKLDRVPGLTVLVRLVTADESYRAAPYYEGGYYRSHYCLPDLTDNLFYRSYYHAQGFNTRSVKKEVVTIRDKCKQKPHGDLDKFFQAQFWSVDETVLVDPQKFHTYSDSVGLRLRLERMFGLPSRWDSRYYQGLVHLLDLSQPQRPGPRFLSHHLDMSSQLRSPHWLDESHLVTVPQSDSVVALGRSQGPLSLPCNLCSAVKFYSFRPEYTASWDKEPQGRLGGSLDIHVTSPDAWSVCPVFSDGYTVQGYHHLPLFKGDVTQDVLKALKQSGCKVETLQVKLSNEYLIVSLLKLQ